MMRQIIIYLLMTTIFGSWALVDAKSGNYKKTFVDFTLTQNVFPLTVERTYNSRSLYKGLFGMGWCSNFETRVEVLPDDSIKLTECGAGQEVVFLAGNKKQNIEVQINEIISVVKKQNKKLSRSYFASLRKRLYKSHILRSEFLKAYRVRGKAAAGQVYFAQGRSNEFLRYDKRGFFRRTLSSGAEQFFSAKPENYGRLIQISDRSGNYVKIAWDKNSRPKTMTDNKGNRVVFHYNNQGEITKITSGGKTLAQYKVKDGNLVQVKNKKGVHQHQYDDLHNLTRTNYPEGIVESLAYDTKKDWVTRFVNERKCVETYQYKTNPKNPNHYWTDVQKMCGKQVTNKSRFEFWNKKGESGSLYLHRARQTVNGEVRDITYHPRFRRALNVTRNGQRIQYKYYEKGSLRGLLRERAAAGKRTLFSQYDKKCRKPTQIQRLEKIARKKAPRKQTIQIAYRERNCLMKRVSRSDGRWVELSHDENGRINVMKDQTGKVIQVAYNNVLNKPVKITQVGVGSIEFSFNSKGEPLGPKQSNNPVAMSQVLSVFNGLVEIVSPVAREVSI